MYAVAVNDVAELQWCVIDGCESICDKSGIFFTCSGPFEMYSMVHENTKTTLQILFNLLLSKK